MIITEIIESRYIFILINYNNKRFPWLSRYMTIDVLAKIKLVIKVTNIFIFRDDCVETSYIVMHSHRKFGACCMFHKSVCSFACFYILLFKTPTLSSHRFYLAWMSEDQNDIYMVSIITL